MAKSKESLRRQRISRSLKRLHVERRRKEKLRRERISRGMRKYWGRVKEIQVEQGVSIPEARAIVRLPPPALFEGTEFAFNLRDVLPDLADRFAACRTVQGTLDFDIFRTVKGARDFVGSIPGLIIFDGSPDTDTFWINYHAAVRDALEDATEDEDYEDVAIVVTSLRCV